MLTSSTIELKEEIYGNLVARYEDLIEGGASPEEALALTKQSMTSIDDVIVEEDEPSASDGPSPSAEAHEHSGAAAPSDSTDQTALHDDSALCGPEPVSGEVDGADADPSACEAPCEGAATNAPEKKNLKRTAMYVIAGFCMIVILSLAAKFLFGFVEGIEDAHEDQTNAPEKKNLKRTAMYVIAGFCMIVILSLAAKFLFGFVEGIEDAHEDQIEASSRYGVRLDGELLNEAGWHQLKADNLYRRHFIERMLRRALGWRAAERGGLASAEGRQPVSPSFHRAHGRCG